MLQIKLNCAKDAGNQYRQSKSFYGRYQRQCIQNTMCKGISARFAQQKKITTRIWCNQPENKFTITVCCGQSIYGVWCKYASNGCIIITTSDLVHANKDTLRILGKYCKIYDNQYFVEFWVYVYMSFPFTWNKSTNEGY